MKLKTPKYKNVDDILKLSVIVSVYHRLPWLLIGLIGGMFASRIVQSFESIISDNLYLAAFIPLVVYISDAVGTQMETLAIRDIAINHGHLKFIRYFLRQFIVVCIIGIILSLCMFVYIYYVRHAWDVAWALSLSLFAATMSSLLTGLLVPYIFEKISFDPANASGPIATIIQDLFSVTIYFMIASWLLG